MKNLQKLGKVLSTKEQKNVNGGTGFCSVTICGVCGRIFPGQKRCGNRCGSWFQSC